MRYHIVGIAGAGMSGLANMLLDQGHTVSGSDLSANRLTAALAARGATISQGHAPANVAGADRLLATAAVHGDHAELVAARAAGIPVIGRADLWREWSQQRPVVAVAGTHGKTTTSAMVALALEAAGFAPGFLVGGEVAELGTNARWGRADAPLVIEADEYDRVFLALTPDVALITNIEWDHPDIYPSEEEYFAAFAQFARQVRAPQRLLLCGNDRGIERALAAPDALRYGVDELLASDPVACRRVLLDWTATNLTSDGSFDIYRYERRSFANRLLGQQHLLLPGTHNVANALGALAVCALLGADLAQASAALARFRGAARRFELKGEIGGVTVIDDYAHHPSAVRVTLAAARARYPTRRIVAYLQPHTFSRTAALREEWPGAFAAADIVLVGDIFAAREEGDAATVAADLAARIAASGIDARHSGNLGASAEALAALVQPGDIVIGLNAGDGYRVGEMLLERHRS